MQENNKLQVILTEQNVAKENAEMLLKAFGAPFEDAGKILDEHKTIIVTKEDQFSLMAEARTKRLALKDIRVSVEKKRKELKEDSLRTGKAIDSVAKFVKEIIRPAEEYLEQQEKFGEIKAAERAAKVKADRVEKLMQYTDDLSLYNIDDMSSEQFDNLLAQLRAAYEAEAKRVADEARQAEADRKAEEKRIADQAKENARLREEADKREAEIEHARVIAENERKMEAEKQAKKDAEVKAEQDRIQAEADVKIAAERAEREKLEQEKRDREALEARQKAEAEDQERAALLAPDKQKLFNLALALDTISETKLPAVKSKQAQDILSLVEDELSKLSIKIKEAAKAL